VRITRAENFQPQTISRPTKREYRLEVLGTHQATVIGFEKQITSLKTGGRRRPPRNDRDEMDASVQALVIDEYTEPDAIVFAGIRRSGYGRQEEERGAQQESHHACRSCDHLHDLIRTALRARDHREPNRSYFSVRAPDS